MKKLIALILAIAMLLTCVPFTVAAEGDTYTKLYLCGNVEENDYYFSDGRNEYTFGILFDGTGEEELDEGDYGLDIYANDTQIYVPSGYLETERDVQYYLSGTAEITAEAFYLYDESEREHTGGFNSVSDVLEFYSAPHADAVFVGYTMNDYREFFGDICFAGNSVITQNAFIDSHGNITVGEDVQVTVADGAFMFLDEGCTVSGFTLGRFTEEGFEEYERNTDIGELFTYSAENEMWMLREEEAPAVRYHFRDSQGELVDVDGNNIWSEQQNEIEYVDSETPVHLEFYLGPYTETEQIYVTVNYRYQGEDCQDVFVVEDYSFSEDFYIDKCNIDVRVAFSEEEDEFDRTEPDEDEVMLNLSVWGDASYYVSDTGDADVYTFDNDMKIVGSEISTFTLNIVPNNENAFPYKLAVNNEEIILKDGDFTFDDGEYSFSVNPEDFALFDENNVANMGVDMRNRPDLSSGQVRVYYDEADGAAVSYNGTVVGSGEIFEVEDPSEFRLDITKPEGVTENGVARVFFMNIEEWEEFLVNNINNVISVYNPNEDGVEVQLWFTQAQYDFDNIEHEEGQICFSVNEDDTGFENFSVSSENGPVNSVTYKNMTRYVFDENDTIEIRVSIADGFFYRDAWLNDTEITDSYVIDEDTGEYVFTIDAAGNDGAWFSIHAEGYDESLPADGYIVFDFDSADGSSVLLNGEAVEQNVDYEYSSGENTITLQPVEGTSVYAVRVEYANRNNTWEEVEYNQNSITVDTSDGKGIRVRVWFTEAQYLFDNMETDENQSTVTFNAQDENVTLNVSSENGYVSYAEYRGMKKYVFNNEETVSVSISMPDNMYLREIVVDGEILDGEPVPDEDTGAYTLDFAAADFNNAWFDFCADYYQDWLPEDGHIEFHFNAQNGEKIYLNGTEVEPGEAYEYADENTITVDGSIYAVEVNYAKSNKSWSETDYEGTTIPLVSADGKGVVINVWFSEGQYVFDNTHPEDGEYELYIAGDSASVSLDSTHQLVRIAEWNNEIKAIFATGSENEITVSMQPDEGMIMAMIVAGEAQTVLVDKIIGEDPNTGDLLYKDDIIKYDAKTRTYTFTITANGDENLSYRFGAWPKLEPEPTAEPTPAPTATPEPVKAKFIRINHKPNKTLFQQGDIFDVTGLVLDVYYTDGSKITVPYNQLEGLDITEPDPNLTGSQYVVLTYEGIQAKFSVKFGGRSDVRAIKIVTKPTKRTYKQGERLDPTGLVVNALNQDLSVNFQIPTDELSLLGYKNTEEGTVVITVAYMGYYRTGFSVKVTAEKVLASIIITKPTKTSYKVGETFDPTGMTLTAKYYDSTTEEIPISKAVITGFDNTTTGTQLISVTYGEKTARFSVKVR